VAAAPQRGRGVSAHLVAEKASISFGGLAAVSEFSVSVAPGDLQGLIGPNGAGKTTVFNLLTGVYQPTSGQITIGGSSALKLRPHSITARGVARTFQNIRLFRELSVLDNVRIACHHRARGSWLQAMLRTPAFLDEEGSITRRAEHFLDLMSLSAKRDELAKNLPYGEQRRLEIARALATGPTTLLLDEPAAGTSRAEKDELMSLIRRLRDELKLGILLIEHDMRLVMGVCESITVLDHGVTIARGKPEEVRKDQKVIEAYLGAEAKA
jgi:branched-chain amino acid transport system ATP-binding protein